MCIFAMIIDLWCVKFVSVFCAFLCCCCCCCCCCCVFCVIANCVQIWTKAWTRCRRRLSKWSALVSRQHPLDQLPQDRAKQLVSINNNHNNHCNISNISISFSLSGKLPNRRFKMPREK